MKTDVVALKDASKVSLFGGKATKLAKMLQAGMAVPNGLAVGLAAFDDSGQLTAVARAKLKPFLRNGISYAVRSSATVEDAADKSWAGQFESYLFVAPTDVIVKVEQCHAAIKARARAYAAETSKVQNISVGVVVQEMIDPAYAGVLFTNNPVSGAHELVVEYVNGVGERLVSGKTTPEDFTWNRKTNTITPSKLIPFDAQKLIQADLTIEALFDNTPQDIEWAFILVDQNHTTQ